MKKVIAILLSLLLVPCAGFAFAVEPEMDCDAEQGMTDQELKDFYEAAAAHMRKRYEELGYTEVKNPVNLEQICAEVNISSDVRALASMDIDNAPMEMREDILEARREIIFRADGWYADEAGIYLVWFDDAKKEWGELPKFSELFPGWDLPTVDSADDAVAIEDAEATKAVAEWDYPDRLFYGRVPINNPVGTTLTAPFKTWNLSNSFYVYRETITKLETSTSANLGLTDMSVTPNVSLGHKSELFVNGGLEGAIPGRNYSKVGFRASTYVNPGYATIKIDYEIV